MCISLPCKVLSVVDPALMSIAVSGDEEDCPEIVSAALVVTPERPVEHLLGAFVLIHAGFALSLISEAEARSRLEVFAAMRNDDCPIDLTDFYAATADTCEPQGKAGERYIALGDELRPSPEVPPHVR